MDDWKQQHANDAELAAEHPMVERVMHEFARNMGFELEGLPRFGMMKVASIVAQVARAQALGFDPELLRLTPQEANSVMMDVAARAVVSGVPVTVIDPDDGGP